MLNILEDQSYKYNYSNYDNNSLVPLLKVYEGLIPGYIKNNKLTPQLRIKLLTKTYSKVRAAKRELDKRGIQYEV